MTLHEGANSKLTLRHYATKLTKAAVPGRYGDSLCSTEAKPVPIYDQAYNDFQTREFGRRRVTVSGLPLCMKCARIADQRGLTPATDEGTREDRDD